MREDDRYSRLIELLFKRKYKKGDTTVELRRDDFPDACRELGIPVPKNFGDVVYSFRYRKKLPDLINRAAPTGRTWIIMPAGMGIYRLEAVKNAELRPAVGRAVVKILDATPGIIAGNAQSDEQGLLAKLRYNRLVDIFLGITCYSLQNHLRTTVPDMGQIEVDEIYLGVDHRGAQYIIPVQAKGGTDHHSAVQIRQDIAMCEQRFAHLICRPVGAQFIGEVIVLMEFTFQAGEIAVRREQHFQLVQADKLTDKELEAYRRAALADG